MKLAFPAIIKDIHISPNGILATLDISPEDVTPLSDLIDKMITVTVTPASASATPPARPEPPLPFEPRADASPEDPPASKQRISSGRKRAE